MYQVFNERMNQSRMPSFGSRSQFKRMPYSHCTSFLCPDNIFIVVTHGTVTINYSTDQLTDEMQNTLSMRESSMPLSFPLNANLCPHRVLSSVCMCIYVLLSSPTSHVRSNPLKLISVSWEATKATARTADVHPRRKPGVRERVKGRQKTMTLSISCVSAAYTLGIKTKLYTRKTNTCKVPLVTDNKTFMLSTYTRLHVGTGKPRRTELVFEFVWSFLFFLAPFWFLILVSIS